ncbi:MAG: DUF554 domain-containing protein [Clostridia bacterium]|nr:DUF554 domain-containing protein [Clostridia bacterium]
MLAVLLNVLLVIVGSSIGLVFKKLLPERITKAVMVVIGLCTVYIGIDGALEGNNAVILILSMALGTALGTLIDIDGRIERLGSFIGKKLKRDNGKTSVAEGFVTASLVFCVGAMTVVGSLNAGLFGDNELLITKSVLDLFSSSMLAASLGIGVIFASLFVLVFQGALVLLAGLLQPLLTDAALVAELTCAGSVMIIGLGINILGLAKFKIANMLPAFIFVPLVYFLMKLLAI